MAKYTIFSFDGYAFDDASATATFTYSYDNGPTFTERVTFGAIGQYRHDILDRTLRLAFLLAGVSYYKCFPTRKVAMRQGGFSATEVSLLNTVYREGLSQYMFENGLLADDMSEFTPGLNAKLRALPYDGQGIIALQSGGKDSLLLAEMIKRNGTAFNAVYIGSGDGYPAVINKTGANNVRLITRRIDKAGLLAAQKEGGLNGHVPVTYITLAYALIDAVLHNENTVLAAIGREGNEAHAWIGDIAVNHQWSKTWQAEQLFADYVRRVISADLYIGSPLRGFYELKIAELFAEKAWEKYGHEFSSCNIANYIQGHGNVVLTWCGECPKCANTFLLFAPFVSPEDLMSIFNGRNLFERPDLEQIFKGLLGIDGVMKPFECVGEIEELRRAYALARERYPGVYQLPFAVPTSTFDYMALGERQEWTKQYAAA